MTTDIKEKRTSIKLKLSTIDMLKEYGSMGETYDEVIRRLMFIKKTGGDTEETEFNKKMDGLI